MHERPFGQVVRRLGLGLGASLLGFEACSLITRGINCHREGHKMPRMMHLEFSGRPCCQSRKGFEVWPKGLDYRLVGVIVIYLVCRVELIRSLFTAVNA
jgi:hypothetical protein